MVIPLPSSSEDTSSSGGEIRAVVVAGNSKKEYEELGDCVVRIDVCKEAVEKWLSGQSASEAVKCFKESWASEVLADLSPACLAKLETYQYAGIKILDRKGAVLYPLVRTGDDVPPAEVEKILEKLKKGDVSCESARKILKQVADIIEAYEAALASLKAQLRAERARADALEDRLVACQKRVAELSQKCGTAATVAPVVGTLTSIVESLARAKVEEAKAKSKIITGQILAQTPPPKSPAESVDELTKTITAFASAAAESLKILKQALQ